MNIHWFSKKTNLSEAALIIVSDISCPKGHIILQVEEEEST